MSSPCGDPPLISAVDRFDFLLTAQVQVVPPGIELSHFLLEITEFAWRDLTQQFVGRLVSAPRGTVGPALRREAPALGRGYREQGRDFTLRLGTLGARPG